MVAGDDPPMPPTSNQPAPLSSLRAYCSVFGSASRSVPPSSPKQSSLVDVMVAGDDAPMPSTSNQPAPPPSSSRAYCSVLGSVLRSTDDVNHAPSSLIAPTALSHREKHTNALTTCNGPIQKCTQKRELSSVHHGE